MGGGVPIVSAGSHVCSSGPVASWGRVPVSFWVGAGPAPQHSSVGTPTKHPCSHPQPPVTAGHGWVPRSPEGRTHRQSRGGGLGESRGPARTPGPHLAAESTPETRGGRESHAGSWPFTVVPGCTDSVLCLSLRPRGKVRVVEKTGLLWAWPSQGPASQAWSGRQVWGPGGPGVPGTGGVDGKVHV